MLKVYEVKSYVSINGEDWWQVGRDDHTISDENPTEKVFLDNAAFN